MLLYCYAKTYSNGFKFRGNVFRIENKVHTGKSPSLPRFAGKLFSATEKPITYSIPDQPKRFAEAKVVSLSFKIYYEEHI